MSAHKGPMCTVCVSPHRAAVEDALKAGMGTNKTAAKFGFSQSAVSRHQRKHLPGPPVRAQQGGPIARVKRKRAAAEIARTMLPDGLPEGRMLVPPAPEAVPSMEAMLGKLGSTIARAETLVAVAEAEGGIATRVLSINSLKSALVETAKLLAVLGPQEPKDVTGESALLEVRDAARAIAEATRDALMSGQAS